MLTQALTNVAVAYVANKLYPNYKPAGKLPKENVKQINQRIKDLFTAKVGLVIYDSADTVVISAFLGLTVLAVYQNYFYILTSITGFIMIIFSSCTAGIGNSIVTESKEKNFNDLEKFTFIISWIGEAYDNLICIDVICHGVPSPALWKQYAQHQEKLHGKIQTVNFRCKDDSWKNFGMKENQLYISKDKDSFMRMFLRDYCLRPSCYECVAKHNKKSDITIADFWGIEDVVPEMNDGKGTSLVIVRTDKGTKLFDAIKNELKIKEISYEEGVKKNPSDYKSVRRSEFRNTFFDDMNSMDFSELEKKYAADFKVSLNSRIKGKIKRTLKKLGGRINVNVKSNMDYGMLFTFIKESSSMR